MRKFNSIPFLYYAYRKKKAWIYLDAIPILDEKDLTDELFDYIIKVANCEKAKNELHGYKEISIFKDGVTL